MKSRLLRCASRPSVTLKLPNATQTEVKLKPPRAYAVHAGAPTAASNGVESASPSNAAQAPDTRQTENNRRTATTSTKTEIACKPCTTSDTKFIFERPL